MAKLQSMAQDADKLEGHVSQMEELSNSLRDQMYSHERQFNATVLSTLKVALEGALPALEERFGLLARRLAKSIEARTPVEPERQITIRDGG